MRSSPKLLLLMLLAIGAVPAALAQDPIPKQAEPATPEVATLEKPEAAPSPFEQALAELKWQRGPATAKIGTHAEIQVPEGYVFLGTQDTQKFMELNENFGSGEEYLFAPEDLHWFALFTFNAVGYVKDDETVEADPILDSVREGTQAGNEDRKERGWSTMSIVGWRFKPQYDKEAKLLEWAILARDDESRADIVNYNTRILGRKGVMEVVLVGNPEELDSAVADLKERLDGFDYAEGERYAEFKAGDHVAEFGLAALIAGGAAAVATKKGFWAVAGAFLLKGWKIIALAVGGAGVWLRKKFGKQDA